MNPSYRLAAADLSIAAHPQKTVSPATSGPCAYQLALLAIVFLFGGAARAQVNVLTSHNDIARTGQNVNETVLTPANVNPAQFGKLFSHGVDGSLFAQPLYVSQLSFPSKAVHNVVYVATSNDSVYAFDADSNQGANANPLWQVSLLTNSTPVGTYVPQWGVLGTPVIDLPSQTIYLISSEIQGSNYLFRVHGLSLTTGAEKFGGPYLVQATIPGTGTGSSSGTLTFDAYYHRERPALLLLNGVLYASFGSNGDMGPWHGWIFSYSQTTLSPIDVFCTSANGGGAGIWMSGAGPAAEVNDPVNHPYGRMFLATGNGSYSAFPPYDNAMNYGMSVLTMDLTGGKMTVKDAFTQSNWQATNTLDGDLSSGGVLLLPTQTLASGTAVNTLVADGKAGTIFILNRNSLGGFNAAADQVVQEVQTPEYPGAGNNWGAGIYGLEAYWNGNIYFGGTNPAAGPLPVTAYSFAKGQISTSPTSQTTATWAFPGVTPSVSSNGTKNGIMWIIGAGALTAYDATNLQTQLYSSNTNAARDAHGPTVIFTTPTIANGKVYAGGTDSISVYGLNPPPAMVNPLTVTIANASMVSGSAVMPQFTSTVVGLVNDDQLGINVLVDYNTTATPTSAPGTYPITATVSGPSAFLYTPTINAGTLTIGQPSAPYYPSGVATTQRLTLNAGAKLNGTRIRLTDGQPNEARTAYFNSPLNIQKFITSFDFQITDPNADGFTFILQNAKTGVSSMGGGGGNLGYTGIPLSVAVKFDLYSNAGEGTDSTGLYIDGAAPTIPAIDLSSTGVDLKSGNIINAQLTYDGTTLTVVLTDTLTNATATQRYTVDIPAILGAPTALVGFTAASGGKTAIQEIVDWTYSAPAVPQPFYPQGLSATQLSLNGGAAMVGTRVRLSDGQTNEVRSTFFKTPVNIQKFATNFNFQIANANADGFTFTIQNDGAAALGTGGASLGYGGLASSAAVKFDIHSNQGEGTNSTGMYLNGASPTVPSINLNSTAINLHSGDIMNAQLVYDGAKLTVVITDTVTKGTATQVYSVDIPGSIGSETAYVGFTGASGGNVAVQDILSWSFDAGNVQ